MSEPSKGGCMASAVHELWMGTFTTRDGGGLRANAQRGTCAASGPAPWGKADATRWFDSDAGVLSEAKPVAPTRASSQRPGLWKPLAPHALRAGFEATPGGGAFYGKTYSFDALSLTARSSFDSFDASRL